MTAGLAIRVMTQADLALALAWAAEEGWNPGLRDAVCFHGADPNGYFLAELDGEPVGSISAVRYAESFGFLGLYIVRPQFRGRGYGMALWRTAMAHFGDRNVGLDGVVAQQANYRKSGFAFAYRSVRYEGRGGGAARGGAIALAEIPFESVARYDSSIFPAPRETFLHCWIAQEGAVALAVPGGDGLRGYGVIRPSRSGFKIGPLFADDIEVAETLFSGFSARAPGAPLILDVPEINPAAVALAERHGMRPVFETARMYTKGAPQTRLDRCFGVTTFELG